MNPNNLEDKPLIEYSYNDLKQIQKETRGTVIKITIGSFLFMVLVSVAVWAWVMSVQVEG